MPDSSRRVVFWPERPGEEKVRCHVEMRSSVRPPSQTKAEFFFSHVILDSRTSSGASEMASEMASRRL